MSQLTLILGGARSGKSSHALRLAEETRKPVTFIATAQAYDDEMSARIQKHKAERPTHWQTLELPLHIAPNVSQVKSDLVILDCVTLWVTNLLMQFVKDDLVDEVPFMQTAQAETEASACAIAYSVLGVNQRRARLPTLAGEVVVHLTLGAIPLPAIALLQDADEFVVAPFGAGDIIVGQIAPGLLGVALELVPLALKDILVHQILLSSEHTWSELRVSLLVRERELVSTIPSPRGCAHVAG